MSRRQRGSLLARLTLVQVGVFGALWLLVIALTIIGMYRQDQGDIEVDLRMLASGLARLVPAHADAGDVAHMAAEYVAIHRENSDPALQADELAYGIWTADGRLVARSARQSDLPDITPRPALQNGLLLLSGWYLQEGWSQDRSLHTVVAKRATYYHRRVRGTVGGLLAMWLVMAVLFAVAFRYSFGATIRPLRLLAQRVAARPDEDLSPIDVSTTYTEVQPLLTALNQKLSRIRALLASERQFFADAAHELRTPLSVISAQAHVLAHEPSLEQRLEALRHIEAGIERGAHAVSKLLLLARLESADGSQRIEQDLCTLVAGAVAAQQARAMSSGHLLQWHGGVAVTSVCDSVQMTVLLDNLIDNALRYCATGCTIRVEVSLEASTAVMRVSDNGPGIPAADRGRVFDRFQRLQATDSTGSGLGLAIVQRIAALHGATVQLDEGLDGRGLGVEIRIPPGGAPREVRP